MKEKKLNLKMSKPQQVKSKMSQSNESIKRWSMDSYLVVDGITKWSELKV